MENRENTFLDLESSSFPVGLDWVQNKVKRPTTFFELKKNVSSARLFRASGIAENNYLFWTLPFSLIFVLDFLKKILNLKRW